MYECLANEACISLLSNLFSTCTLSANDKFLCVRDDDVDAMNITTVTLDLT